MLWGIVMGSPLCWDTLLIWGCLPFHPPHSVFGGGKGFQCIGMFQGYQYVLWAFPSVSKGLGVFPPSVGGGGGIST